MENRVPSYEERQLTNAIERAATVASINESLDRNQLLADHLKKASVDPKFAKTAAQAFNKRLTVLTLRKTADEHKAEPFELTDPDAVYQLVAGNVATKTAAINFDMTIEQLEEAEAMEKAASVEMPKVNVIDRIYEKLVSWDTMKDHIYGMIDKYASAFRDLTSIKMRLENTIDAESDEVASYFKNANYNFDFTTAINVFGSDAMKDAIGDKTEQGVSFEKTANFAIRPVKPIFDKIAKLLQDKQALHDITDFMIYYKEGLEEFCKSASALADEYQIKEADLQSQIQDVQSDLDSRNLRLKDIKDQFDSDSTDGTLATRLGGLANIGIGTAAGLGEGLTGAVNDITGAARTALNNAKALYYAGNNVSISPGDLLDAAFLTKDRYRDRLLAWSDMSADPQLAMYPAEQVFAATQKAMDMDTSMERPDQREVLRAQVAQLLAQNNRVSTADIAALAATLKSLSGGRGSAAAEGDRAVSALSAKEAPAPVDQEAIVGQFGDNKALTEMRQDAASGLEDTYKELKDIEDRGRKERADEIKGMSAERDSVERRLQSLKDKEEERKYKEDQEAKRISDNDAKQLAAADDPKNILREQGYREVINPATGKPHYVWSGGKNTKRPPAGVKPDLSAREAQNIIDAIRALRNNPAVH